jgi:hypothetical protein
MFLLKLIAVDKNDLDASMLVASECDDGYVTADQYVTADESFDEKPVHVATASSVDSEALSFVPVDVQPTVQPAVSNNSDLSKLPPLFLSLVNFRENYESLKSDHSSDLARLPKKLRQRLEALYEAVNNIIATVVAKEADTRVVLQETVTYLKSRQQSKEIQSTALDAISEADANSQKWAGYEQQQCHINIRHILEDVIQDDKEFMKRESSDLYKSISLVIGPIVTSIMALKSGKLIRKANQKNSKNIQRLSKIDARHGLNIVDSIKEIDELSLNPLQALQESSSTSTLPLTLSIGVLRGLHRALPVFRDLNQKRG